MKSTIIGCAILTFQAFAFAKNLQLSPKKIEVVLPHKEFRALLRTDQNKYLNQIISALSEIENVSPFKGYCVIAGEIYKLGKDFGITNDCKRSINKCESTEIMCPAWIGSDSCVAQNKKLATKICWDRQKSPIDTLQYLLSKKGQTRYQKMQSLVNKYCHENSMSVICKDLAKKYSERKARPSWLKRAALLLKTVIFPLAWASENCFFDETSGLYTDQSGKTSMLVFGVHGRPEDVREYFDYGDEATPAKTFELLSRHEDALPKMRKNFEQIQRAIKSRKIKWFGLEADDEFLKRDDRINGLYLALAEREEFLKKMGLQPSQIHDVLLVLYNPLEVALYRAYQSSGEKFYIAGIDNMRNEKVDQLEEKLKDPFERFTNLYLGVIKQSNLWFLDQIKGINPYADPLQASRRFETLLREPDAKTLAPSATLLLQQSIDELRTVAQLEDEYKKLSDAEFAQRDIGMATDINRELSRGAGLIHLGSKHRDGVIKKLVNTCRHPPSNSNKIKNGKVAR